MNNEKTNENNLLETKYIYNVCDGKLLNGAKKFNQYNFIYYIGGINNGYSEIAVKVLDSCLYYLILKYISYENNLSFKINVNNIDNNKVYYADFSSQWSINLPLTFTIPIVLNSGDNIIKFYGNGIENSPYIGEFLLCLPKITTDLAKGVLENKAYVDVNSAFVSAIGGANDGSTTITMNIPKGGGYNLILDYICGDVARPLKIDINGMDSENIYTVSSTENWDKSSMKKFTIATILNLGNNTIKFHGDGINYGPNLGNISITPISNNSTSIFVASKTYKISTGTLINGAILDKTNNSVTKIGGVNDGYVIVKVPVDVLGDYLLKLNYINGNKALKIDINGIQSQTIYNLINKSGVFTATLPLVVGVNQLKFYGNGKDYTPDLIDFTIELIKNTSSEIFNGVVSNKASIDTKGFITGIGGIDNGIYIMEYKAKDFGWYDLYLTLDSTKGQIFALDINFDIEDLIYTVSKSNEVIVYIISLLLNKDINIIKIHGDYKNNAPDILKIEIKLNTIIQNYNYKFIDGTLENGATIDFNKEVVENIGGINNGAVTIETNINIEAYYDLNIRYIGESKALPLKIDVINDKKISTTTICKLPKNFSERDFSLESFKINLPLSKGINKIKFYGNQVNEVPKLKEVQILESALKDNELFSKTYELTKASLYYGAKASAKINGFVENVSGDAEGRIVLRCDIPRGAEYKIDVSYLTINNAKLAISVNSNFSVYFIQCPKTNSLRKEDAKIVSINLFLKERDFLGFNGTKDFKEFFLGKVTITENKLSKNNPCKINSINYYNGARLYGGQDFITLIGGPKRGKVKLNIDILTDGFFDLGFKYICAFNIRTLNIEVNEGLYTNSYQLPLTENWNMINAQTFTIPLKFKKGSNIVVFEGNENEFAPIIGKFNLVTNKTITEISYKIEDVTLKNGTKINSYGLLTNIGGPKKGEALVKVNIKNEGKYILSIQYKPIYETSKLEIVINNRVYYMENEEYYNGWSLIDMPILKARVYLSLGENIINFRGVNLGDGKINYAPFLGNFILVRDTNNYKIEKNLSKGSYDLTKGKLENGADIFQDFVVDLGGNNNGTVTIIVNVEEANNYFMTINYLSLEESYLMFDVNGEENGNIYLFENIMCSNNQEEFKIKLKQGDNIIKFYGIKNMLAPKLSIISIIKVI